MDELSACEQSGPRAPFDQRRDGPSAESIRAFLGAPVYRRLFSAVRRRIETAGFAQVEQSEKVVSLGVDGSEVTLRARSVKLQKLSTGEREAIADLHGWRRIPENPVVVDLSRLDAALRTSRFQTGLLPVLEILGGPLVDRRARREADAVRTERMWVDAASHPAVLRHPRLNRWLERLRSSGTLTKAARRWAGGPQRLLNAVLSVLARLPAHPEVMLQVLAGDVAGDAHALDAGRPLGSVALRALAYLADEEPPSDTDGRRRLWARFGVLCDALSSHVLSLGIRPLGIDSLSCHLREWSEKGEPVRLTLRAVGAFSVKLEAGAKVYVCENPAIIGLAADRLGSSAGAIVCTEGVPSLAVWRLLEALCESGAAVKFHADLDWSGVQIGNLLTRRLSARPWRMCKEDYESFLKKADGPSLTGREVTADWDPGLSRAMRRRGVAVLEEQVVEDLLEDLAG